MSTSKPEFSPAGSKRESQRRFTEWEGLEVQLLALKIEVTKWEGIQTAYRRRNSPHATPHPAGSQQGNRDFRPRNQKESQGTRFCPQLNDVGSRFFSLQMRAQPSQHLDFNLMRPWAENLAQLAQTFYRQNCKITHGYCFQPPNLS